VIGRVTVNKNTDFEGIFRLQAMFLKIV